MQHHTTHRYIVSFGHRNTTRGGAAGEFEWTPGAGRALAAELRALGATVYIVHEHDGDGDSTFTHRPLGAIGQIVAEINRTHGPCNAYLSMHYGAEPVRGFFLIPPDAGGLRHGGTGQLVTNDAWESNALDIQMARNIAAALEATNTIPPRTGLREPGIMSERQSGVGLSGWRLAELQESIGVKRTTARLILEAGNNLNATDRAYIHNPAWVSGVYVPAIVAGLRATFGAFPRDGAQPTPPKPEQPGTVYATADIPAWIREMSTGKRLYHRLDTGELFHAVNRVYRTKGEVPRRQYAIRTSKAIGEPVPAGTSFMLTGVGENRAKEPVGISPWGTRFFMDDLEAVGATDTPDQ